MLGYGFSFARLGRSVAPAAIVEGWNTSALEAGSMTFSNSNRTAVGNNNGGFNDTRVYSLAKKSAGKWFASIRVDAYEYGDVAVTDDADAAYVHFDYAGVIYSSAGGQLATLAGYSAPCVIDMAFDATSHLVWFRVNGGNWNGNASYDPSAGTGGYALPSTATAYHVKANMPYFAASQRTINAGSVAFTYPAPSGFSALGS